jgi:uncharacterized protein YjbI with pentapeptide repeats
LLIAIGIVAAIGLIVAIIGGYWYNWEWIGVGHFTYTTEDNQEFQRGKTLWDWMQLLIVPVVLAVGAFLFNRSERRNEQYIAEQRAQDATLQTYLDQMTELLLKDKEKLYKSQLNNEVRQVARVRTLTALRRLDSDRRNILLRFLHDAKLIGRDPGSIIDLKNIDLTRVDLSDTQIYQVNLQGAVLEDANLCAAKFFGSILRDAFLTRANLTWASIEAADLSGAKLIDAILHKANLRGTKLHGSILYGADLTGAILHGADLTGAFLKRATVTEEQLKPCKTLRSAILPDGTKVPDDQDFPPGWK